MSGPEGVRCVEVHTDGLNRPGVIIRPAAFLVRGWTVTIHEDDFAAWWDAVERLAATLGVPVVGVTL